MKQFTHCVMDSIGIHARPAGLLARAVKAFDSTVVITKADGRSANASKLMAVMSLGIKTGETITVHSRFKFSFNCWMINALSAASAVVLSCSMAESRSVAHWTSRNSTTGLGKAAASSATRVWKSRDSAIRRSAASTQCSGNVWTRR